MGLLGRSLELGTGVASVCLSLPKGFEKNKGERTGTSMKAFRDVGDQIPQLRPAHGPNTECALAYTRHVPPTANASKDKSSGAVGTSSLQERAPKKIRASGTPPWAQ